MEGIREAAQIYYRALSDEKKQKTRDLFREADKDGDGRISAREFVSHLERTGAGRSVSSKAELFRGLDADGDGTLDFEEAVALFYLVETGRPVMCDGCHSFLRGSFFGCFQCHSEQGAAPYHLCVECYKGGIFEHHDDAVFLDNFTLLNQCRTIVQKAPTERIKMTLEKIHIVVGAAYLGMTCSIM